MIGKLKFPAHSLLPSLTKKTQIFWQENIEIAIDTNPHDWLNSVFKLSEQTNQETFEYNI